jgi:hypothetical protein
MSGLRLDPNQAAVHTNLTGRAEVKSMQKMQTADASWLNQGLKLTRSKTEWLDHCKAAACKRQAHHGASG